MGKWVKCIEFSSLYFWGSLVCFIPFWECSVVFLCKAKAVAELVLLIYLTVWHMCWGHAGKERALHSRFGVFSFDFFWFGRGGR